MTTSCLESCVGKQKKLKQLFAVCTTPEQRYQKIIDLGRSLPPFPEALKKEEFLIPGCQSALYLHAALSDDQRMIFLVGSDAL
ncbi:MAG: SufE family protein, partial [Chlamydiales bacterium]|nr:SufE family protein [Chlamydiales bacterium]